MGDFYVAMPEIAKLIEADYEEADLDKASFLSLRLLTSHTKNAINKINNSQLVIALMLLPIKKAFSSNLNVIEWLPAGISRPRST